MGERDRAVAFPLRVASYNVHRCTGGDGKRDVGRVGAVIRQLDTDLIGLQEVDSRTGIHADSLQLEFLAQATGLTAVSGPTLRYHNGHVGNALLSRHPLEAIDLIDVSQPGREPRGAIDARLKVAGRGIRVVVTHLGLRPRERDRQIRQLITSLAPRPDEITLLLGDMNEWLPWSPALCKLHRRFGLQPGVRSFPARWPVFALDRIWVSPRHALRELRAYRSPLTKIASDHLPVRAVIDPSGQ